MSLFFSHAERFVFPIPECLWGHYLLCRLGMQVCIQHGWWFGYYLCVWAVGCVCWRGVWEGHHCNRIIMEIPNPDLPALSVCHRCLSVPYSYFFISFHSLPSPCVDLKVVLFTLPVCSWNIIFSPARYFGVHLTLIVNIITTSRLFFWIETRGPAGVTKNLNFKWRLSAVLLL